MKTLVKNRTVRHKLDVVARRAIPYVGAELEIDGRPAVIRSIGAGRVQVDYNHPLAGRQIVYKLKVVEHITDEKDKIRALIGRRFLGIETSEFNIRKTKKKLRIGIPDQIFFSENIQIAKRGVALDLLRYFDDIDEITAHKLPAGNIHRQSARCDTHVSQLLILLAGRL